MRWIPASSAALPTVTSQRTQSILRNHNYVDKTIQLQHILPVQKLGSLAQQEDYAAVLIQLDIERLNDYVLQNLFLPEQQHSINY